MHSDIFWSLFAMPIGVTICFGPAVVTWMLLGSKTLGGSDEQDKKH